MLYVRCFTKGHGANNHISHKTPLGSEMPTEHKANTAENTYIHVCFQPWHKQNYGYEVQARAQNSDFMIVIAETFTSALAAPSF